MELNTFLSSERGRASQLADYLNVSATTIHEWASGKKQVPQSRCQPIEQFSEGRVTCEELRSDLADQFAYLRGTEKAA